MGSQLPRGLGEAVGSLICFTVLLGTLIAIDDRVRDRVTFELSGATLNSWGGQARSVTNVLIEAAHDQSIQHAPLLIFSLVAVVLVVFMLRT
jgi:hypothetical protein